ncbi:Peroxisomal membrane protein PEX14 [Larimichthys crocea]|uniref:Uncharacterized protein n=1 Tax=Larimichthys crocea TaxID=215358 RepID=A0ACD3RAJ6_LARCR|nr:Peroxisomal membrane protein PEX14 [Larimichthys crocea]
MEKPLPRLLCVCVQSSAERGLLKAIIKITTAVKFLQNPKVRQSPLATRKAFLKKKGLTDVEVELGHPALWQHRRNPAFEPCGAPTSTPCYSSGSCTTQ